jgi:hypothetical protein
VPLEACISGDNKYLLQGSKWSHSWLNSCGTW